MSIQPIAVTRAEAAKLLGVSIDLLKTEQRAGRLKAKNTHIDPQTGRASGSTLYSVKELQAWFDGLDDA